MPLSISNESAFVTAPQLRVTVVPGTTVIVAAAGIDGVEAVNEVTVGVPLQVPVDEEDDDEDEDNEDELVTTLMTTVTFLPKNVPVEFRIRQTPVNAPPVDGAVIGTETSAVEPGTVAGTLTAVDVVIAVPLTKTNWYPATQGHEPLLLNRQILLNV